MAFSPKQVQQTFRLKTLEQGGLFTTVAEREISDLLRETLADHLDLAIDLEEYSIKEITKIVGILCSMVEQTA